MIKQVFHLSEKLNEKLESNIKSDSIQLKVDETLEFLKKQCKLDVIEKEFIKIDSISQIILNHYNRAIVVGVGGALLSSRSIVATENYKSKNFNLIYSDSLSYKKQQDIFTEDNLLNSAIIIISRSGNSVETISQAYSIVSKYKELFGEKYPLSKHFFLITSKCDSRLRELGNKINATFIEYIVDSGKFSSLTAVGLLPAKLIGLSPEKIVQGALESFNYCMNAKNAACVAHSLTA